MTPKPWTPPGDGWIEHRPGDACPVGPDDVIEYLMHAERKSRRYISGSCAASDLYWGGGPSGSNIVAYRIARSRKEMESEIAELRKALTALARVPAVVQALGSNHTSGCTCPLCVAQKLTGDKL